ncbi:hypothetical protein [Tellurirhabdus rosea]|uniref:hypothetical protein n=1 Tax=Tellurirhabdus rosea TaxID=2674997 RepID=UPI00225A3514|nr:hypothetical protein [Tellurirhabdus rosea]
MLKPLAVCLPLLLAACTGKSGESSAAADRATDLTGCYAYVSDKDTVLLQIDSDSDSLTGRLTYHYYEKDRNTGTFAGQMLGDTLLAFYRFQSEGTSSVRQVAFLRTDSSFVEGYGDVVENGGRMVFSNRRNVQFQPGVRLTKTTCP